MYIKLPFKTTTMHTARAKSLLAGWAYDRPLLATPTTFDREAVMVANNMADVHGNSSNTGFSWIHGRGITAVRVLVTWDKPAHCVHLSYEEVMSRCKPVIVAAPVRDLVATKSKSRAKVKASRFEELLGHGGDQCYR